MHRRRCAKAAGALLVLGVLAAAGSASAHRERALHALTVVKDVEPDLAGVDIWVDHFTAPSLVARNRTDSWLVILDRADRPFLRIRKGSVELNASSPTTYASLEPGGGLAPRSARPGARAEWVRVATRSTWSWFDPRIEYRGPASEWTVDALYSGEPVLVRGGFERLDGHGHFEVAIEPSQTVPGLEIRLLSGPIPGLFVRNDTEETLSVPGARGEPFLRIGPNGVEANMNSPSYYLGGSQTIAPVPARARAESSPEFQRVSAQPMWAWLELGARLPVAAGQRETLGNESRIVHTWATPMMLGEQTIEVTGTIRWHPPVDTAAAPTPSVEPSSLNPLPIAAALAALIYVTSLFSTIRRPTPEPS